jgi:lipopolysaccharide export system permease protein
MFFKLIFCIVPDVIGLIFPVSSLLASILVSGRMNRDKEMTVLMTSGKTPLSIFAPFLLFASIISACSLLFQGYIAPNSLKSLNSLQETIQNKISMSVIKPGIFNVIGNSVIYIGKKTDNSIEDIFVSYVVDGKKASSNIITAKFGKCIIKQDAMLIELGNGYRQELDKNNSVISTLKFEHFSYDVTQFIKKHSEKAVKPHSKTQWELIDCMKSDDNPEIKAACTAEFHGRLAISFISIVNSIIAALFMFNAIARRSKNLNAFYGFSCGLFYQVLVMTVSNAAAKHEWLISANYSMAIILTVTLLFAIARGRSKS